MHRYFADVRKAITTLLLTAMGGAAALAQSPMVIIRKAVIMTMAEGQKAPITGYVSVDAAGKILAVAAGEPAADLRAAKLVDAQGDYMIPGIISAHSHIWQAAYRGLAEDKTTPPWGRDRAKYDNRATPEDTYWFTLYGSLDHLQHGITTVFDFAKGGVGGVSAKGDNLALDKAQFRGKADSGIRFERAFTPGGPAGNRPVPAPPMTFKESRVRLQAFLDWVGTRPPSKSLRVMLSGAVAGDGAGRFDGCQHVRADR